MIHLTKSPKPAVLVQNEVEWTDEYRRFLAGEAVPAAAQFRYRHTEIKQTLRSESSDKCIYCESKISHVFPGETDHILPLSKRPDLVVGWQNLAYVCKECNREKRDYYSPAEPLINPYVDDPSDHLVFYGPMVLNRTGSQMGFRTVTRLKLSKRMSLLERRKERLEAIQIMLDLHNQMAPGATRDLLWDQIELEASSDKEFSAFVRAFLYQSTE